MVLLYLLDGLNTTNIVSTIDVIVCVENAAKRKEESITAITGDPKERDNMDTVKEDITVIVDAIVPVEIKKVVGENSNLKRKKEKNLKNTRKN